MIKTYAIELFYAFMAFVVPYLIVYFGRVIATYVPRIADVVIKAINEFIDRAVALSKLEIVDKGLMEAKNLIGPIVSSAFTAASKEIIKDLSDGSITKAEAAASLKNVGTLVQEQVKSATAEWKLRMKPYLGDTDQIIASVTEEIYEVVKRNFQARNSEPAQPSGVPPQK